MRSNLTLILLFGALVSNAQNYEVFVSSRGNDAVKRYDENGTFLGDFVPSGYGGLDDTQDILFHPDGSILVSGIATNTLKNYDGLSGTYLGNFTDTAQYTLTGATKMKIGPDSLIYVTQWSGTQRIVRFQLDGTYVDEFTNVAVNNGLDFIWDADTNLYVVVFGSGADGIVQKFDKNGIDQGAFINSTYLQGPTSMWRDSTGDWFVEDWTTGDVKQFDSSGNYIVTLMSQMTSPEGIDSLPNGDLLIGDWGQDCVHHFSPDGTYFGYFTSGNSLLDANSVKVRMNPTAGMSEENVDLSVFYDQMLHQLVIGNAFKFEQALITIYTMDGKVVMRTQSNPQNGLITITTGQLISKGVYILDIKSGHLHYSKKFVP